MTSEPEPEFREMPSYEVDALLRRNHVGRLAFSFRDAVDIRPLNYTLGDGWLFGRTSPGEKLVTLRHNQWVAFEVDEIVGPFEWKSVIVRGTFYRLAPEGSEYDVKLYHKAVAALRTQNPKILTKEDPLAARSEVFGISIDGATGRECSVSA